MTELETALAVEVERIRQALANADEGHLHIEIEIDGRVCTGEIKVEFTIGEHYDSHRVKGNNLDACTTEFLRRKGWQERHDCLMLPAPTVAKLINDEIPF